MADPGTLIPADISNAMDTTLKPSNPKLNTIPTFPSLIDTDVVYSGRKTLHGEGSSQNSESSEKAESFWGAIGNTGVGSSGIPKRATQLDHLPTSAFETSRYRGNRGAHAVDGVRTNINVVPYAQNNLEDSNSLFAEFNPFQIKGTGKAPMYNRPVENKADELQRPRNNLASYTKNVRAHNEVPKKKEYDYLDGIIPRVNREPNGHNPSSSASTSSTKSDQINAGGFKSTAHSNMSDYSQSGSAERENNVNGFHDRRKFTHERFMETNSKLKDPESCNSSFDSISSRVEQVFDDVDVSESEIPWEDLVIGERIGLGTAHPCSDLSLKLSVFNFNSKTATNNFPGELFNFLFSFL